MSVTRFIIAKPTPNIQTSLPLLDEKGTPISATLHIGSFGYSTNGVTVNLGGTNNIIHYTNDNEVPENAQRVTLSVPVGNDKVSADFYIVPAATEAYIKFAYDKLYKGNKNAFGEAIEVLSDIKSSLFGAAIASLFKQKQAADLTDEEINKKADEAWASFKAEVVFISNDSLLRDHILAGTKDLLSQLESKESSRVVKSAAKAETHAVEKQSTSK